MVAPTTDAGAQQGQPAVETAPERSSPFEAVRWNDAGEPEVMYEGVWYTPVSIQGVAMVDVITFCTERYTRKARKRFEEDIVEVLNAMGHTVPAKVSLVLRTVEDRKERVIADAAMTEANRRKIWQAAVTRDKAAGEPGGPAGVRGPERLGAAEARSIVGGMEKLLREQHSYTAARGHDPTALLAPVRACLEAVPTEGIPSSELVNLLETALAPVGDGHVQFEVLGAAGPAYYLPATLAAVPAEGQGRIAALEPNARQLLDPAHPFVSEIDDVPIERWLSEASANIAAGSPQLVERRALRSLSDLPRMRSRLGLAFEGDRERVVSLTLMNAAGDSRTVQRAVGEAQADRPAYAPAPRVVTPGITYVRIGRMIDDQSEIEAVRDACLASGTGGLILDLRGNGGGDRILIREIGQLIMPAESEPVVFNAARPLRLPGETAVQLRDRLDTRYLRTADDPRWTAAERDAIARFSATFKPALVLDDARFHPLHYAVLTPAAADAPRVKGRVAVLLDAGCFSATDIFLCALKALPGVTLIGAPSGGGSGLTRRHDLGQWLSVRLSTMVSFQPDGRLLDGHGVAPHEVILPGVRDFTGSHDAMLERAKSLLVVH